MEQVKALVRTQVYPMVMTKTTLAGTAREKSVATELVRAWVTQRESHVGRGGATKQVKRGVAIGDCAGEDRGEV
jgi:hypothetical protein